MAPHFRPDFLKNRPLLWLVKNITENRMVLQKLKIRFRLEVMGEKRRKLGHFGFLMEIYTGDGRGHRAGGISTH